MVNLIVSFNELYFIQISITSGPSIRQIVQELYHGKSTIYDELNRNRLPYNAKLAHTLAKKMIIQLGAQHPLTPLMT